MNNITWQDIEDKIRELQRERVILAKQINCNAEPIKRLHDRIKKIEEKEAQNV